jgi:hypothetical protein
MPASMFSLGADRLVGSDFSFIFLTVARDHNFMIARKKEEKVNRRLFIFSSSSPAQSHGRAVDEERRDV